MEIEETKINGVIRYTSKGIKVYRIPAENFPNHFTNVYLIMDREASLVDVGIGREKARTDLERGWEIINREFKESIGLEEVRHIIITHGHIDHFGMLSDQKLKGKRLYIHQLDSQQIKNFPQESSMLMERTGKLVKTAGCSSIDGEKLSFRIQFSIEPADYDLIEVKDEDKIVNGYTVYHTPGHSLGEICLGVGDFLFLGDLILSVTTPHQSPKSEGGAGLEAYLDSLKKVAQLPAELGLPGHEDTVYSVKARVEELEGFHYQRLEELVELCQREKNLAQLTREYYEKHPELMETPYAEALSEEYNRALALDEIKAHVEYLLENNRMVITRIKDGVVSYQSRQ